MSLANFQYGIGAVIMPGQQDEFDQLRDCLIADTRPANFAEQLVVDQILHAQWELHRVRLYANNTESEEALHAATNRANRNWQRAVRQLAALQSAAASATLCIGDGDRGEVPPMANLAKIPRRKKNTRDFQEWRTDMFEFGYHGPSYFDFLYEETPAAGETPANEIESKEAA